MTWWQEKPMRLLQTNLREIDLPLDPRAYAETAAALGANVALFNLGGIVANYPTRLSFQFRNPRIQTDIIPDLIGELHGRGIRLIGRFDFSKVNETIAAKHPEWLYRDLQGEPVIYNGQAQCCVNGAYQQECSLAILEEALDLYPLDGVFFNMIGFQTTDYSGVVHGICQCQNCRDAFRAFCGADLPVREDRADPVYQHYLRFTDQTSRALFRRIRDTIKTKNPACAICTYTNEGVDIFRSEANSGIRRPQPEFVYSASLNVRRVRASWREMAAANAAVHFIDFPYRHAGVSPALTARRMAQNFIHGGWLDYYVIGRFDEQHDRACQPAVKQLFGLHRRAEEWLAGAGTLADACLIEAGPANPGGNADELRGWISLLSEMHILYDVVEETALAEDAANRLSGYPLVILPGLKHIPPALADALDGYVKNGGRLLLTGLSAAFSASGQPLDRLPLAVSPVSAAIHHPHTPGTYFAIEPAARPYLPGLDDLDWIPLDTPWLECTPVDGAQSLLQHIPVGMFGPPEKCYYTERTEIPGLIVRPVEKGVCAVLPWQIGSQYRRFPTHALSGLAVALLDGVLRLPHAVEVEAPPVVEVSAFRRADGQTVVGLVNLSGQNGPATHAPVPVRDLRFTLPGARGVVVETLNQGILPCESTGDGITFTLPCLELMEMIRIKEG